MAKVSTLDLMKHDGEVYVKVARKAEVGEKIVIVEKCHASCSYSVGDVYGITTVDPLAGTQDGRGHLLYRFYPSEYNVLVLLKPGSTVTINGEEYSVMGDGSKAQVGDLVVVVDSFTDAPEGDVFKVYEGDDDRNLRDNDGDERDLDCWEEETVTLRKVSATSKPDTEDTDIVEYNGVKYRKVKRNVREGDKYIVALINDNGGDTKKGGIYEIYRIDGDGDPRFTDSVGDVEQYLCTGDYAVLEPIPVSIEEQIAETERKLAELKAEQERQQAEAQRLKVGDYAVVVDGDNTQNCTYPTGTVIEIVQVDDSHIPYRFKPVSGGSSRWAKPEHIRRATPEEVAEAQTKLAEEQAQKAERERWAAIGREVGEIRKGDIVRVTDGYGEVKEGDIGIITDADVTRFPGATVRGVQRYVGVELVTPVEQRFDRKNNVA